MMAILHPTRRGFLMGAGLAGASTFSAWAFMPRMPSQGAARDPRFLKVILRGGMDGLAVVEPTFESRLERVRSGLVLGAKGSGRGLPLDGGFTLNPQLAHLHAMYEAGEVSILHAVATPYRGRSHFDGQDVLESGMPGVGTATTGWMNRAMSALSAEGRVTVEGVAIDRTVPLIMRGRAPTLTWNAGGRDLSKPDMRQRLLALYQAESPILCDALDRGLKMERLVGDATYASADKRKSSEFVSGMKMVGRLFTDPGGPRVGAIDLDGWDTHAAEEPEGDNLGKALTELDAGLAALKETLGTAWNDTVVVVSTEFGRTVSANGSDGTDHGTATVAFLAGGAVKGGRVIADWPGLAENALFEGRDLMPTTDLRGVYMGILRDHFGVSNRALTDAVFPGSAGVRAMDGLLQS